MYSITSRLAAASECGDAASRDGLSGVNLQTNGTEFYGNSSNLAFLGNLFARAQHQAENRDSGSPNIQDETAMQKTAVNKKLPTSPGPRSSSSKGNLSIVNLLYNADYTGQPSPPLSNATEGTSYKRASVDAHKSTPDSMNQGMLLSSQLLSKISKAVSDIDR